MRYVYLALVVVSGCFSPNVEAPTTTVEEQKNAASPQTKKDKVDLLFLIDDSPSMKPKQVALQARFPDLIKKLNEIGKTKPVSYHIGVVTSDFGANGVPGCGHQRGGGDHELRRRSSDNTVAPAKPNVSVDYNI